MRRLPASLLLCALAALVSGCEQLGIDSPATTKAKVEADGKAIGGACRQAMRGIEDCYTLNKKGDKSAIYAGWREMEEYMRENKLEPVAPVIPPEPPKPAKLARAASAEDGEAADEAPAKAAAAKH